MYGQIWLADLARVLAIMRPESDKQRVLIAQMLGLGPILPPVVDREFGDITSGDSSTVRTRSGANVDERIARPVTAVAADDLPVLKPVRRDDRVQPVGWSVDSLPAPAEQGEAEPPPHQTLLSPRTSAAILTAAASRRIAEGPLDLSTVVDALARHCVIGQLPRARVSTLRFGVQVLIDIGESMQQFGRDQQQLLTQIQTIVGAERTNVMYFADSPLRGAGPGPGRTWSHYQPPTPGTRILALSHLGMAGPPLDPHRSRISEWRLLTRLVQRSGCDIAALVPLPRHRWLPKITMLLPLICWDRSTTVSRVTTVIGDR